MSTQQLLKPLQSVGHPDFIDVLNSTECGQANETSKLAQEAKLYHLLNIGVQEPVSHSDLVVGAMFLYGADATLAREEDKDYIYCSCQVKNHLTVRKHTQSDFTTQELEEVRYLQSCVRSYAGYMDAKVLELTSR